MTLGIDISNYSGPIDATQAVGLKSAGVGRVVVQLVNESIVVHRSQFSALVAMGFEVEAYVYLWFGSDIAARVQWAIGELVQRSSVKRVWLDCEDTSYEAGQAPETVLADIRTAKGLLEAAGYEVGIYTAGWWWEPATGNSTEFAALPLWDAHYDGNQSLDDAGYGGWGKQAMKQYQGDTTLAGVPNVDLDWYEEEAEVQTTPITESEEISVLLAEISAATQNNALKIGAVVGQPKTYLIVLP